MRKKRKKIGIVGGADPSASCLLYEKIIDECLKRDDCANGADFPEMGIINFPFTRCMSITDAQEHDRVICGELQICFDKLDACGVDIVAIACNTLHNYVQRIDTHEKSFVHIIKTALQEIKRQHLKKVLLLGTQTTVKQGLYRDDDIQLVVPLPDDQKTIDEIIVRIHTGKLLERDSELLSKIVRKMHKQEPFEGIILGCTDLPVLHNKIPLETTIKNKQIVVIDTVQILAEKLTDQAFADQEHVA